MKVQINDKEVVLNALGIQDGGTIDVDIRGSVVKAIIKSFVSRVDNEEYINNAAEGLFDYAQGRISQAAEEKAGLCVTVYPKKVYKGLNKTAAAEMETVVTDLVRQAYDDLLAEKAHQAVRDVIVTIYEYVDQAVHDEVSAQLGSLVNKAIVQMLQSSGQEKQ